MCRETRHDDAVAVWKLGSESKREGSLLTQSKRRCILHTSVQTELRNCVSMSMFDILLYTIIEVPRRYPCCTLSFVSMSPWLDVATPSRSITIIFALLPPSTPTLLARYLPRNVFSRNISTSLQPPPSNVHSAAPAPERQDTSISTRQRPRECTLCGGY